MISNVPLTVAHYDLRQRVSQLVATVGAGMAFVLIEDFASLAILGLSVATAVSLLLV